MTAQRTSSSEREPEPDRAPTSPTSQDRNSGRRLESRFTWTGLGVAPVSLGRAPNLQRHRCNSQLGLHPQAVVACTHCRAGTPLHLDGFRRVSRFTWTGSRCLQQRRVLTAKELTRSLHRSRVPNLRCAGARSGRTPVSVQPATSSDDGMANSSDWWLPLTMRPPSEE